MDDLIERLRETPCNREPFTPSHAQCQCRVAHAAADEIQRLRDDLRDAPVLVGQIVLAAGGWVRVPAAQLQSGTGVVVARQEDDATGETIFTATLKE